MAEVHIVRYSTNPQIKSFQATELPPRFWAPDSDTGMEREYTFKNEYGEEAAFIIDKGGTMKLDTTRSFGQHNYESLQAILRRPQGLPPGSEFKLVNLEKEAEGEVALRDKRIAALVRIDKQKTDLAFVASLGRRLGLAGINALTPKEVLNHVQTQAESNPQAVLDILDSVYQKELFELDKARDADIISLRQGFFYYGQIQLGVSEGSVVDYFHRHPDVFADIVRRNARIYGGAAAAEQDERIRDILMNGGSPQAPQVASSIEPILPDAPAGGTPDLTAEARPDAATEALLRRAREAGIVNEESDGHGSNFLAFTHISLVVPNGPSGMVKQALSFLANPANKGVRRQIQSAVEQVERSEKEPA